VSVILIGIQCSNTTSVETVVPRRHPNGVILRRRTHTCHPEAPQRRRISRLPSTGDSSWPAGHPEWHL